MVRSPDAARGALLTDAQLQGVLWAIDRGIAYDDGFPYPRDQNREILRSAREALVVAHPSHEQPQPWGCQCRFCVRRRTEGVTE